MVSCEIRGSMIACEVRDSMIAAYERSTVAAVEASACIANSARTSVETVVRMVVDVAAAPADVVVAAVVPKMAAAPISAVEAGAEVAEAVVDAAVVADGRAPVSGVPEVAAGTVTPVAGSPKGVDVGRCDPGAIDPFIAVAGPSPVTGSPDVAVAGGGGLVVDRDGGRRDGNRDKNACMRLCGNHKESSGKNCCAD